MSKRIVAVMLAVMLSLSFGSTAMAESYHESDVEEYIMQQLISANIPGMSVSIVTSGKEVYSAAFGDVSETTSDLKAGMLSKTFTATAIMQLVEADSIKLEDKVTDYLTDYDELGSTTIEELVNQTSGLTDDQTLSNLNITDCKGDFCDARVNYNLLGKVIEKVSGESYSDYISEKILTPLEMKSTYTVDDSDADTSDLTNGHSDYFGLPISQKNEITESDGWNDAASTGVISDAKDMGAYLQMYLDAGGKVLSYKSIQTIYEDGIDCDESIFGTASTYSMGWIKTTYNDQDVYYYNGVIDGYASAMFLIPSMDVGVTMMFDSSDVVAGDKLVEKIESGAVSLVMGGKAKTIDSKSFLMPHIEIDAAYLAAVFIALLPMILMSGWYRWSRKKFSVIRTIIDVLMHVALPTALIFVVPEYFAKWNILKVVIPDLFYVAIAVIAILYIGIPVKIIAGIVAAKKGPMTEEELASLEGADEQTETEEAKAEIEEAGTEEDGEPETEELEAGTEEDGESEDLDVKESKGESAESDEEVPEEKTEQATEKSDDREDISVDESSEAEESAEDKEVEVETQETESAPEEHKTKYKMPETETAKTELADKDMKSVTPMAKRDRPIKIILEPNDKK